MTKLSKTPEYSSWQQAKGRCFRENSPDYHRYGGRGITMCVRWRESFEAFLSDMGQKPTPDHSLDRKDNNDDYRPGNCRWATRKEQQNNLRTSVIIAYNGELKTLKQWCEHLGLKYTLIYTRLFKLKWTTEKAFITPSDPYYNPWKRKK